MMIKRGIHLFFVFTALILFLSACSATGFADGSQSKADESIEEKSETLQESLSAVAKKVIVGYADYPHYASLADLGKRADYIIYGTVLSKRYEFMDLRIPPSDSDSDDEYLNPGGDDDYDYDYLHLVTIYEVSVSRDYKDTEKKDGVVQVVTFGGETEDTIYMIEGSPEIKTEEKYIFFIAQSPIVENGGWLLNDNQSLYSTDGHSIYSVSGGGFELTFDTLDKLCAR